MVILKTYDLTGQETGEISLEEKAISPTANAQMIKDYLVALRTNARQWSANTKTRAEVRHSGQKPHAQKGLGRARQGSLAAPQYKGGGRVFGPRPKFDQHVRLNRKERQAVIRHLLAEKIQQNKVYVLKYKPLAAPKTKTIANFLSALKLNKGRILFLAPAAASAEKESVKNKEYDTFIKSMRNIPKTEFRRTSNFSGYDVILSHSLIVMDSAVEHLTKVLGGE